MTEDKRNVKLLKSSSSTDSYTNFEVSDLTENEKQNKDEYFRSIVDTYDKDKTGYIEEEELELMLKTEADVSKEIVGTILRRSDNNQDNKLDFNEFVDMLQDRSYKKFFKKYVNMYIKFVLPPNKRRAGPIDDTDAAYEELYTCFPPPIAIAVMTAFELACFFTDRNQIDSKMDGTGVTAKMFIYDPYKRQEFWRFLTYMFVHLGYTHLIVNSAVQVLLGVPLEMAHKWWRVLLVYFCGVLAGSLGSSIFDPKVCLAGASGGVYALITAHIGTIIMNWNEMTLAPVQLCIFLVIIGVDIGTSIYDRYWSVTSTQISYSAHITGAFVGLLVGIWILKNIVPSRGENYIWWIALILFILVMGSMILLNVFWVNYAIAN